MQFDGENHGWAATGVAANSMDLTSSGVLLQCKAYPAVREQSTRVHPSLFLHGTRAACLFRTAHRRSFKIHPQQGSLRNRVERLSFQVEGDAL